MSKLTDLKAEQLTIIEGLGLSEEHLPLVKSAIDTLTEAHNDSEVNVRYKLENELATANKTIENLKIAKPEPTPATTDEGGSITESNEYKLLLAEKEILQACYDELNSKYTDEAEKTEKQTKREAAVNAFKNNNIEPTGFEIIGLMQIMDKTEDGKYIVKNEDDTVNLVDNHISEFAKTNPNRVVINGGTKGTGVGGDSSAVKKVDNSIEASVNRAWGVK